MAACIRRNITAVLKGIQTYTREATQLMGKDVDEGICERLRSKKLDLESAIARIVELDTQWTDIINSLDATQKMAEESIYMNFPHNETGGLEDGDEVPLSKRHFLDQNEFAREVLNMVSEMLNTLERSRTNSRQSALSESNHSVDLNEETNNARTNHLDARMNNTGINHLDARTNNSERNNAGLPVYHALQPPFLQPRVNLPPLHLPHFSGDSKDWPTFWQMFSSTIDNEPSYNNVVKMNYLLSLLDGPVLNVVAGYLPTNENYPRVVELLKTRYGDSKVLKEALQSELYHLAPANDSVIGLRKFLDVIERVCRQLSDYGIQDDSWIIFALKEKLPRGILAKLIEKEKMAGKTWKIENWRSELNLLISVKEEVQRCTVNKETEGPPRRERRPFYQPEPTRSFPVANQPRSSCCSLCQGNHFPSECTKYGNTQARKDRLLEQNRCLKCLREGHQANDCPNHRRCSRCQGPHHFLVCFSRDVKNQNRPKFVGFNQRTFVQPSHPVPVFKPRQFTQSHPIWERRDQPYAIVHGTNCDAKLPAPKENSVVATVMDAKNKPTAYLMTKRLMVTARGRKERIPVYVFFDTGSQTSFVSRRLVEKLNPPRGREIDQLEIHGFGGALSNPLKMRSPTYLIKIQRTDGRWEEIALNCTEEIATPFDMLNVDETYFSKHPEFEIVREKPDIMIGIRQFWKFFVSKGKEILPGLHSIRTIFGTMTAGETHFGHNSNKESMSLVAVHSSNEEHLPTPNAVEDFWSLESIGIKENPSQNDDEVATKLIEKSITVTNEGRYSVRWPWKEENPRLDSNFKMAYSRLISVLEGLKGSDILEKYDTQIKNQLAEGIIEEAAVTLMDWNIIYPIMVL
uniref:CCHC-type domain-containing protein n=1 Tax=Meloidogyne enterolobii TaxID=390850 RepID=A0A6V7YD66_MELEN|nr:unnamed protein product [Meloidogyne enterolobii]